MTPILRTLSLVSLAALAACASPLPGSGAAAFDQSTLPAAVQVPPGHRVTLQTVGRGDITYECRAKAGMPEGSEWVFVGPVATLTMRDGRPAGRYFGPPATWAAADGSALTGGQLAVAPAGAGNIPLQLVKANPASGAGVLQGTTHIQRLATRGGVAPALPCAAAQHGQKQVVNYQADYIFWAKG